MPLASFGSKPFTDAMRQVTQGQRVDSSTWTALSPDERAAIKDYQRDHFGTPARSDGGAALGSGGGGGVHWAGNGDPLAIHVIQGTGDQSPFAGQLAKTGGVVTSTDEQGFFVQEPKQGIDDGSPAIYVHTGGPPSVKVGDDVAVQGRVIEFQKDSEKADFPNSSMTQIDARHEGDVSVRSSGNALPAAVVLDGRTPITENLEGVRVRIPDAVVVGAPNDIPKLSDMAVLANNGAGAGPRTIAGGLQRPDKAVIGVRMNVDNLNEVDVGARFKDGLEGNVVERHGHYQVRVQQPTALTPSAMKRETTTLRQKFPDPTNVLFVGSINAENKDVQVEDINKVDQHDRRNVDDDVGDGKLTALAQQIVTNMAAPDVVAMQEIQDNDGAEISDVTDASRTWNAIIEEIVKQGGPRYAWCDSPPVNGKEGGQPGGNIRTGFLYNPQRVSLVEKHRMEGDFTGTRVPLVATFDFKHGSETERVTLSSVHNKSKRSGEAESEDMRNQEEAAINTWAKKNAPKTKYEHLGVYGDRNAATGEKPLAVEVQDGALKMVTDDMPADRAYSTQFGGSSALIDHASVKTSVPVVADIVHTNSDFDARRRSGDHDPIVTAWDFRRQS
jgi:predicted extracellular nuclease